MLEKCTHTQLAKIESKNRVSLSSLHVALNVKLIFFSIWRKIPTIYGKGIVAKCFQILKQNAMRHGSVVLWFKFNITKCNKIFYDFF